MTDPDRLTAALDAQVAGALHKQDYNCGYYPSILDAHDCPSRLAHVTEAAALRRAFAAVGLTICPDPDDHALADAVRGWLAFLRVEAPCPECGHDEGDHVAYCAADGASACGCLVDITAALEAD